MNGAHDLGGMHGFGPVDGGARSGRAGLPSRVGAAGVRAEPRDRLPRPVETSTWAATRGSEAPGRVPAPQLLRELAGRAGKAAGRARARHGRRAGQRQSSRRRRRRAASHAGTAAAGCGASWPRAVRSRSASGRRRVAPWATGCARATFIRAATRACPGTSVAAQVWSTRTTARTCSRIAAPTGVREGRHLYSVRFEAGELSGDSAAPAGAVYADLEKVVWTSH